MRSRRLTRVSRWPGQIRSVLGQLGSPEAAMSCRIRELARPRISSAPPASSIMRSCVSWSGPSVTFVPVPRDVVGGRRRSARHRLRIASFSLVCFGGAFRACKFLNTRKSNDHAPAAEAGHATLAGCALLRLAGLEHANQLFAIGSKSLRNAIPSSFAKASAPTKNPPRSSTHSR